MSTDELWYEIEGVGSLGHRFALFEVHRHRQDNGTSITTKHRIGSVEVNNPTDAWIMVENANKGVGPKEQAMSTQNFNINLTLESDAIRQLSGRDHVSPSIMETILMGLMREWASDGRVGVRVNYVEYLPWNAKAPMDEDIPNEDAIDTEMLDTLIRENPTPIDPEIIKDCTGDRVIGTVPANTSLDVKGYRDDYPDMVGDDWELAMDKLGHNVTSHLNMQGPCEACRIQERPSYIDLTREPTTLSSMDAYAMGQKHCTRFMEKQVNPMTEEQFKAIYPDPSNELYEQYRRGYNDESDDLAS